MERLPDPFVRLGRLPARYLESTSADDVPVDKRRENSPKRTKEIVSSKKSQHLPLPVILTEKQSEFQLDHDYCIWETSTVLQIIDTLYGTEHCPQEPPMLDADMKSRMVALARLMQFLNVNPNSDEAQIFICGVCHQKGASAMDLIFHFWDKRGSCTQWSDNHIKIMYCSHCDVFLAISNVDTSITNSPDILRTHFNKHTLNPNATNDCVMFDINGPSIIPFETTRTHDNHLIIDASVYHGDWPVVVFSNQTINSSVWKNIFHNLISCERCEICDINADAHETSLFIIHRLMYFISCMNLNIVRGVGIAELVNECIGPAGKPRNNRFIIVPVNSKVPIIEYCSTITDDTVLPSKCVNVNVGRPSMNVLLCPVFAVDLLTTAAWVFCRVCRHGFPSVSAWGLHLKCHIQLLPFIQFTTDDQRMLISELRVTSAPIWEIIEKFFVSYSVATLNFATHLINMHKFLNMLFSQESKMHIFKLHCASTCTNVSEQTDIPYTALLDELPNGMYSRLGVGSTNNVAISMLSDIVKHLEPTRQPPHNHGQKGHCTCGKVCVRGYSYSEDVTTDEPLPISSNVRENLQNKLLQPEPEDVEIPSQVEVNLVETFHVVDWYYGFDYQNVVFLSKLFLFGELLVKVYQVSPGSIVDMFKCGMCPDETRMYLNYITHIWENKDSHIPNLTDHKLHLFYCAKCAVFLPYSGNGFDVKRTFPEEIRQHIGKHVSMDRALIDLHIVAFSVTCFSYSCTVLRVLMNIREDSGIDLSTALRTLAEKTSINMACKNSSYEHIFRDVSTNLLDSPCCEVCGHVHEADTAILIRHKLEFIFRTMKIGCSLKLPDEEWLKGILSLKAKTLVMSTHISAPLKYFGEDIITKRNSKMPLIILNHFKSAYPSDIALLTRPLFAFSLVTGSVCVFCGVCCGCFLSISAWGLHLKSHILRFPQITQLTYIAMEQIVKRKIKLRRPVWDILEHIIEGYRDIRPSVLSTNFASSWILIHKLLNMLFSPRSLEQIYVRKSCKSFFIFSGHTCRIETPLNQPQTRCSRDYASLHTPAPVMMIGDKATPLRSENQEILHTESAKNVTNAEVKDLPGSSIINRLFEDQAHREDESENELTDTGANQEYFMSEIIPLDNEFDAEMYKDSKGENRYKQLPTILKSGPGCSKDYALLHIPVPVMLHTESAIKATQTDFKDLPGSGDINRVFEDQAPREEESENDTGSNQEYIKPEIIPLDNEFDAEMCTTHGVDRDSYLPCKDENRYNRSPTCIILKSDPDLWLRRTNTTAPPGGDMELACQVDPDVNCFSSEKSNINTELFLRSKLIVNSEEDVDARHFLCKLETKLPVGATEVFGNEVLVPQLVIDNAEEIKIEID